MSKLKAVKLLALYTDAVLTLSALMESAVPVPDDVLNRTKHEVHFLRDQITQGLTVIQSEEIERLRQALEWYADRSIYEEEHFDGLGMKRPALVDKGLLARVALMPESVKT